MKILIVMCSLFFSFGLLSADKSELNDQITFWKALIAGVENNAKPNQDYLPAGKVSFLDLELDCAILLNKNANSAVQETILDTYSLFSFSSTSASGAIIWKLRETALTLLAGKSSSRVRSKAYRFILQADNGHANRHIGMLPECILVQRDDVKKIWESEHDKKIKDILNQLVEWQKSEDPTLRTKAREILTPPAWVNHQLFRRPQVEDWLKPLGNAPEPPDSDADAFKKCMQKITREFAAFRNAIDNPDAPELRLLLNGTPRQKTVIFTTAEIFPEETPQAFAPELLNFFKKTLVDQGAPAVYRTNSARFLAAAHEFAALLALNAENSTPGLRVDIVFLMHDVMGTGGKIEFYPKVLEFYGRETDSFARLLMFLGLIGRNYGSPGIHEKFIKTERDSTDPAIRALFEIIDKASKK